MKTIFITGASAGLGKATAILFQSKGWKVIATMRNPEKETELTKLENIILLPLDVTNAEQVNKTVQIALDLADIDVVFNNAGYGLAGAFEAYSDKQIVKQINTNFLGVLRVAKPFVSYFRENSKEALFITTTSSAGIAASPLSSVYSATKFALEGWSEAMNYDTSSFGIIFKTIAPGGISTAFGTKSLDVALHPAYEPLWNRMMEGFQDGTLIHFSTPESIAQVVYQAATDGKQQLRYPAGPDAVETDRLRQELGLQSHSDQIRNLYNHKS
jgi:NAD(P)-dependent dehydrogenase (short-subunit alcohol dehydrogenase family)